MAVEQDFNATVAAGEKYFEHFGVKGMKWGVIRQNLGRGARQLAPSDDHIKARTVKGKAQLAGVHSLSNKELSTIIKRMDLEVKYKDLKDVKQKQSLIGKGASWLGKVGTNIIVGTAISWLQRPGARPSSTTTWVVGPKPGVAPPAPKELNNTKVIDGTTVGPLELDK